MLATAGVGAFANEPASQADLRAAYCLPHQKHLAGWLLGQEKRTAEMEEMLTQARFKVDKLSSYLNARIDSWSMNAGKAVLAASESGEKALRLSIQYSAQCQAEVTASKPGTLEEANSLFDACRKRLGFDQLRLEQCRDVNFLPY